MKAIWEDKIIAESDETEVLESNHYFPRASLKEVYFVESDKKTSCFWKGEASYLTVVVDGKENRDAAWYYAKPKEKKITGMVAFWQGVNVVQ